MLMVGDIPTSLGLGTEWQCHTPRVELGYEKGIEKIKRRVWRERSDGR